MGSTLEHGIYLPSEGEKNCYQGLAGNWNKVDGALGDIAELKQSIESKFTKEIVTELPTEDINPYCIYMILKTDPETDNVYDEWVYINNNWEYLGNTKVDMTQYYTKQEVNQLPAVASGVTATKVGNYDAHIANGDIHVTASDKAKWDTLALIKHLRLVNAQVGSATTIPFSDFDDTNGIKAGDKCADLDVKVFEITAVDTANQTVTVSPLLDIALDANVVHNAGDETVAGKKTFSDDSFFKSLNYTREVASPSSSNVAILPIVANITFTDQSQSQSATLNLRISADGSKTFYPNENGLYSLGLVSRNWDNVYSYMFESFGKNLGNEFSNNARTNLYLKANRDTGGQSGVYVSKFRQNRAQGEMSDADVVQVTFDVLENSVRTNRLWYLNWVNWENDVPKTVEVRSLCEKVDYKLTHINGLTPSALGMPNLDNGIDISSYLDTSQNSRNYYTPSVNGWISIKGRSSSVTNGMVIMQGDFCQMGQSVVDLDTTDRVSFCMLPVMKNVQVEIWLKSVSSLDSAKFFPCQGNV